MVYDFFETFSWLLAHRARLWQCTFHWKSSSAQFLWRPRYNNTNRHCQQRSHLPRRKQQCVWDCYFYQSSLLLVDRTFVTPNPPPPRYFLVIRWSYTLPTEYQTSVGSYFNISNKSRKFTIFRNLFEIGGVGDGSESTCVQCMVLPIELKIAFFF